MTNYIIHDNKNIYYATSNIAKAVEQFNQLHKAIKQLVLESNNKIILDNR